MKTAYIVTILLAFVFFLYSCAKEEPGIEGSSDQWLSNDTIAVRGIPVYRSLGFPPAKESFVHMLVGIRNESDKELQVRWVRAEFRGKGINPNMTWSPLFKDSLPEKLTVKGIVRSDRITEPDMSAEESELDFVTRILQPRDTCIALLSPSNPGDPSHVKLKVRFADGTLSRPFLITVNRSSEGR